MNEKLVLEESEEAPNTATFSRHSGEWRGSYWSVALYPTLLIVASFEETNRAVAHLRDGSPEKMGHKMLCIEENIAIKVMVE